MKSKTFSSCVLFLGICLLGNFSLHADVIPYGDFAGDTVNFIGVTEISAEDGALYGAPTVDGDSLNFLLPPGFISQSEDGGVDFIDGRLTFMVEAMDGFLINSISVDEFGGYFNFGEGSFSSVTGIAFVQIGDLVLDASFLFSDEATGNDPSFGPWSDGLSIEFDPTESITFFFDNQLFTTAADGGAAFIDKKDIKISVGTVPAGAVPEPTSGMLLIGLCVGFAARRRRS